MTMRKEKMAKKKTPKRNRIESLTSPPPSDTGFTINTNVFRQFPEVDE